MSVRGASWIACASLLAVLGGCSKQATTDIEKSSEALVGSLAISGVVTSSRGPVAGATVKLQGSDNRTTFSDASGHYSIASLSIGSYQLSATAGNSCASSIVNLNGLTTSPVIELGLTGTGCASFIAVAGPSGPAGAVGPAGPAGIQGVAGIPGPIGMQGAPGANGADGADGAPGVAGPMGLQGIQGLPGVMGPAGADGATGMAGPPGAPGAVGAQGPAGPVGPPGAPGDAPAPLGVIGSFSLNAVDSPDDLNDIPIRSFAQTVEVARVISPSGGFAGSKPALSTIQLTHDNGFESAELSSLVTTGKRSPSATLLLANGSLKIVLTEVTVKNVSVGALQNGVPLETFSLAFQQIQWTWSGAQAADVIFDARAMTTVGDKTLASDFAFFGPGVDPASSVSSIAFTQLSTAVSQPGGVQVAGTGEGGGKVSLAPLTMVTAVGAETIQDLGAVLTSAVTDTVQARFVALGSDGAPFDRLAYKLQGVEVSAVDIDSTPNGTLEETLSLVCTKINWLAVAQSPRPKTANHSYDLVQSIGN